MSRFDIVLQNTVSIENSSSLTVTVTAMNAQTKTFSEQMLNCGNVEDIVKVTVIKPRI